MGKSGYDVIIELPYFSYRHSEDTLTRDTVPFEVMMTQQVPIRGSRLMPRTGSGQCLFQHVICRQNRRFPINNFLFTYHHHTHNDDLDAPDAPPTDPTTTTNPTKGGLHAAVNETGWMHVYLPGILAIALRESSIVDRSPSLL